MNQKVLVTPILGLPQVNGWAQVTRGPGGKFVCAFSVDGMQAGNVGRDLVDLLEAAQLENSNSVYSIFKKLVRTCEDKGCNLQAVGALFDNSKSTFVAFDGFLLLKRNGKVGTILKADREVKIIEGHKTDDDIFVMMTNASQEFKEEIVQKLMGGLDADTIVTSVIPGVQNLSDSSLISMAFVADSIKDDGLATNNQEGMGIKFDFDDEVVAQDEAKLDSAEVLDPVEDAIVSDSAVVAASSNDKKVIDAGAVSSKFLSGLKKLFFRLMSKLWQVIIFLIKGIKKIGKELIDLGKKVFSGGVYVPGQKGFIQKNFRKIIGVIAILVLLVTVAVVLRFNFLRQRENLQEEISPILREYKQAQRLMEKEPIEARDRVLKVISDLEAKKKAVENQRSLRKIVEGHLEEVEDYYQSFSGQDEFQELPIFFDFKLVELDFVSSLAASSDEESFFFDEQKKNLVTLNLETKEFKTTELGDSTTIKNLKYDEGDLFLIGDGVSELNLENGETEVVIEEGKANRDSNLFYLFDQNIYVLNEAQRNIFKYSYDAENDEYGDPVRWVKSAPDINFDEVSSLVIDGNVWLGTDEGRIFKLEKGETIDFVVKGLSEPFSKRVLLYTKEDMENLYVLEPDRSRLVILNKNGDFIREVKSLSLATASDLIIAQNFGKAFILSGSLVFEVVL